MEGRFAKRQRATTSSKSNLMAYKYRKVALAGTFDAIHSGHVDLFDKAFSVAQHVLIGITTDEFAHRLKHARVRSFAARKKAVMAFLGKERLKRAEIFPLDDAFGPAVSDDAGLEALVVSTETLPRAEEINRIRESKGLSPLDLVVIPLVYAENLKKIASSSIRKGKISAQGELLKPVFIAVGSRNPSKVEGVKALCGKLFPRFRVISVDVDSTVSEQPFAFETLNGAVHRALAAQRKTGADYGVGLESGLFEFYGRHFDFQWCAVFDGKNVTLGCSMGFEVPRNIVELVKRKKIDMGRAFEELTGIQDIGKRKGAINYLSRGIAERKYMSEQAFLCAMIPRLNRLNYGKFGRATRT